MQVCVWTSASDFSENLNTSKLIDFGETQQEVSDEFYAFFTAHAAMVETSWDAIIESIYTLVQGIWKWNSEVIPATDLEILSIGTQDPIWPVSINHLQAIFCPYPYLMQGGIII
jgi:hypothetical protein